MYSSLSLHHLYTLLDCLIQAHRFARNFNANSEQRTLLWKSGFIGNAKPNLLKQETQSLSCCLRVMFRLYFDQSRSDCWSEIETRLLPLCSEVISYFLSLTSEAHGEAWTAVLLLLFTQLERLEEDRLKRFAGLKYKVYPASILFKYNFPGALYPLLCQIWCVDVRPEVCSRDYIFLYFINGLLSSQVCSVLRNLFLRIGQVYEISTVSNGNVERRNGPVSL